MGQHLCDLPVIGDLSHLYQRMRVFVSFPKVFKGWTGVLRPLRHFIRVMERQDMIKVYSMKVYFPKVSGSGPGQGGMNRAETCSLHLLSFKPVFKPSHVV